MQVVKIIIKKAVILILVLMAGWPLVNYWKKGLNLDFSIKSSYDQLFSTNVDSKKMIEKSIANGTKLVYENWRQKTNVMFVKTWIIESSNQIMIELLYENEKVGGKEIKKLAEMLTVMPSETNSLINKRLGKERETITSFCMKLKAKWLRFEKFSETDYEELKNMYPAIILSYADVEELRCTAEFLLALAGAAYLGNFSVSSEEYKKEYQTRRQLKEFIERIEREPFYAFALFYLGKEPPVWWAETLKSWGLALARIILVLLLCVMVIFLCSSLVFSDFDYFLDKELNQRGIEIDFWTRMKVLKENWKLFLRPWRRGAIRDVTRQVAQHYQNTYNLGLLGQKRVSWLEAKKETRALKRERYMRQATEITLFERKRDKRLVWTSRSKKDKLIEQIKTLITEIDIDYSEFKPRELENLKKAYLFLKDENEDLLAAFLNRNDIPILVQTGSFTKALENAKTNGDLRLLYQKLGIPPEQIEAENQEELINLPVDLIVIVIGGRKSTRNRGKYIKAIDDLGSREVSFVEINKQRQIEAVVKAAKINPDNYLFVILADCSEHTTAEKIYGQKNLKWILVRRAVNPDKVKIVVSRKYRKKFDHAA